MSQPFREELDADGVLTLTLDRPERLNALTFEIYRALTDRFFALRTEDEVRAVVLAGAGRAFCSGGDVRDIIGRLIDMPHAEVLAFTRMTGELIANIRRLEKPVIAAVHGYAGGAGAVIAAAADLRVFGSEAKIAFLFTKVGLTGADMGAAWLLPRLIGESRATELLLLGEAIDAETAERWGLANRVVPTHEVLLTSRELARQLARGPTAALATTKRLIDAEAHLQLEAALEAEAQAQAVHLLEADHREYHAAFSAKRPPVFSGARRDPERQP